ncbi:hypothetical protein Pelo_1899 [Pelomyxa schiedti]|nr:hypothetical protein Pelo_1899 [Pelomyxa schiedti]
MAFTMGNVKLMLDVMGNSKHPPKQFVQQVIPFFKSHQKACNADNENKFTAWLKKWLEMANLDDDTIIAYLRMCTRDAKSPQMFKDAVDVCLVRDSICPLAKYFSELCMCTHQLAHNQFIGLRATCSRETAESVNAMCKCRAFLRQLIHLCGKMLCDFQMNTTLCLASQAGCLPVVESCLHCKGTQLTSKETSILDALVGCPCNGDSSDVARFLVENGGLDMLCLPSWLFKNQNEYDFTLNTIQHKVNGIIIATLKKHSYSYPQEIGKFHRKIRPLQIAVDTIESVGNSTPFLTGKETPCAAVQVASASKVNGSEHIHGYTAAPGRPSWGKASSPGTSISYFKCMQHRIPPWLDYETCLCYAELVPNSLGDDYFTDDLKVKAKEECMRPADRVFYQILESSVYYPFPEILLSFVNHTRGCYNPHTITFKTKGAGAPRGLLEVRACPVSIIRENLRPMDHTSLSSVTIATSLLFVYLVFRGEDAPRAKRGRDILALLQWLLDGKMRRRRRSVYLAKSGQEKQVYIVAQAQDVTVP